MQTIDADWVLATMNDALNTMEELVMELEGDPEAVDEILNERMPALYAKLNYAWNTRFEGPEALDNHDHNDLIVFPKDLTF